MPPKKITFLEIFLLVVILFCVLLIVLQNFVITGKISESSTISNVSISKHLSISFSNNLSEGIIFGTILTLPAVNQNATHNYDGTASGTSLFINVSADGNTNVDFCIKANAPLTSLAADTIGVGNETYANSTTNNVSIPALASETSLGLSYVKSGANVSLGGANYYRFWLDIPVAQPSGDYNNTISFKGVQTGVIC